MKGIPVELKPAAHRQTRYEASPLLDPPEVLPVPQLTADMDQARSDLSVHGLCLFEGALNEDELEDLRTALGQQAEAASGKRMSWMETAARLALPIGALGVPILRVGAGVYDRRAQERRDARDAQWVANTIQQNYDAAEAEWRRREERAARRMVPNDLYRFANDRERVLHGRTLRAASAQGRDARQLRAHPHLRLPNNEF